MSKTAKVLLLFLDGVGIGSNDPDVNPFMRAQLPTLTSLQSTGRATLIPLDATLGMPGLPQSGTGQTALFTGINAAREFGRHFGPWVPTALRPRLAAENVLTKAVQAGRRAAFANAYPEELFDGRADKRMADPLRAGPPVAAMGAGVLTRHTSELERGDAIASEIVNDGWRTHLQRTQLPVITAQQAGQNLARIAAAHELTLFAHYATDYVGHRGDMAESVAALERVDEFLGALVSALPEELLVVIASDHGNIEDVTAGHTFNPALGLVIGSGHREFAAGLQSLTDVAPRILARLGISTP